MRVQKLAYFITAHGFGHAARATAVISAINKISPQTEFSIFSEIPDWFIKDSTLASYKLFPIKCDVGLVQHTAMDEDLGKTILELEKFVPFDQQKIDRLARIITDEKCSAVLCDISPLGILVAKKAGVPSFLIENFTWDWIYEGYLDKEPAFTRYITLFRQYFSEATFHIQTTPVCSPFSGANLLSSPVSRNPRTPPEITRKELGIPNEAKAVLITMGGIPDIVKELKQLSECCPCYFVVPGGSSTLIKDNRLVSIPHHSNFYHPDLISACDAAVGKAGYSTISEIYYAGIPFGYINRADFRESATLEQFIRNHLNGLEISIDHFQKGTWIDQLPQLLALPRLRRHEPNGAEQIASFILDKVYHSDK